MGRYQRHIFVCQNERPPGHPRGCCAAKGAEEIRRVFKEELAKRNLSGVVRTNSAGCLDACEHGLTVVIYPEGIWYGKVRPEDVAEIIDRTIVGGEVIQRLLVSDNRYRPDSFQYPRLDPPDLSRPE